MKNYKVNMMIHGDSENVSPNNTITVTHTVSPEYHEIIRIGHEPCQIYIHKRELDKTSFLSEVNPNQPPFNYER